MKNLIKWAQRSDDNRWKINKDYEYPFLEEINQEDKDILKSIENVGYGEISGIGSSFQMLQMGMSIPDCNKGDWAQIATYNSIISYEEFRHGSIILALNGIKLDDDAFADATCIKQVKKELDSSGLTAYSLLLSFATSEATNIIFYDNIIKALTHPKLKEIFENIKRDESRHYSAWRDLIGDLINKDPAHKQGLLDGLDKALGYHNAEFHSGYRQGARNTGYLWGRESLSKVISMKFNLLEAWFGEDNPYTIAKLKVKHVKTMRGIIKNKEF